MGLGPHSKNIITLNWFIVILTWDYDLQWDWDPIVNTSSHAFGLLSFGGGIMKHNGIGTPFQKCNPTNLVLLLS